MVSPVVNAAVVISVASISPTTTRPVCRPRRGRLRRPLRNMTRLVMKMNATLATATAKMATRANMMTCMSSPNRDFMLRLLLGDDLAIAHVHKAVAARADALVVGDDDEGLAVVSVQLLHDRDDVVRRLRVERSRRLVRPDDRRAVHQRARDRHALALAAGELRRLVLGAVREVYPLECRHRALAGDPRV